MRIAYLIILFSVFAKTGYSQKKGYLNTSSKKFAQDTIIWKKDSLLTADNFKSKGKKDEIAFTCSAIFFHAAIYNPSIFFVDAIFIKSKSYIRENAPYVLKHEQLHFDITELYSRKLRQVIRETDFKKVKNISAEITKMYAKVTSEAFKEQNKYDKDTEHGLNAAKQEVWNEDIAKRLAELDEFSATEIDVVN